jgi:hypothetical protein
MSLHPRSHSRHIRAATACALFLTGLFFAHAATAQSSAATGWAAELLSATRAVEGASAKALGAWEGLEKKYPVACDWMQQDFQAQAWDWLAAPQVATVRRMMERVLRELAESGLPEWKEVRVPDDPEVSRLLPRYLELCEARRRIRLRHLEAKAPRVVFTKHWNIGGSHYAYTEGQSDAQAERHFYPGSALCLLSYEHDVCRVEPLLQDKQGILRDPDVSYDGKRLLFAWKKSDRQDDYHLYEMELATRRTRQLTFGLGVADYEGVYLPDGEILFNSTRCVQIVDCWWTEVSNLYRCDRDGGNVRRVTFDQVHDNYPTVTEDGRILYTRWEYNDRSQIFPQPLLQMMPDGTGQTEFYGGNSWFPTTILHARGVPGTQKAVAIATGHHSRQTGKLILLDPARGRQENQGAQLLAPLRETKAERIDSYGQNGELFQYPYPLSESEYLVTYHPTGWQNSRDQNFSPRFGIYLMTIDGRRELLASDPNLPCNQPVPLRARPLPFQRPNLVDYRKTNGTFYVQDVYAGPAMHGVRRGTVKTLRVVALEFRAVGIGNNGNGGPGGGALISTPVAIGNGTWDPKTILGDATIHPDGSVLVTVPARTPVYFQLLDEKGRMVQSMRSWTSLQPGENGACVGCHENKNTAALPTPRPTQALLAGPEKLRPFHGSAGGFSYAREIQPILEARCVSCHAGPKATNGVLAATQVLDRGAKRKWAQSYLTLTHARPENPNAAEASGWRGDPDHKVVNWISAASVPTGLPPYSAGSNRSKLIDNLEKGHHDLRLPRQELEKLAAWIDLGVPFCGDYTEAQAWTEGEKAKYQRYFEKRQRLEAEERQTLQALIK